jgi:hypothetical protein
MRRAFARAKVESNTLFSKNQKEWIRKGKEEKEGKKKKAGCR